jgi:PKD repeat protein
MKRLYFLSLVALACAIIQPAKAQRAVRCAADEQFKENAAHDPSLLQKREQIEREIAGYTLAHPQNNQRAGVGPRIIPVVVHVLHQCGGENISKEQILDQIRILNLDYRRLNADTVNTPVPFRSRAADCNIEFRLAQLDPDGNCTDGIERYETPRTDGWIPRDSLKRASRYWPPSKYLNLWVVKNIDPQGVTGATILGYAQFPGGDTLTDGVVIRSDHFGSIGTAVSPATGNGNDSGRVATHEVGHWLSLRHIWGDDNGSCSGSDLVSDTPNEANEASDCPSFPQLDICAGSTAPGNMGDPVNGSMFMNYMDYSDGPCQNIFTQGQLTRINATLSGVRSNIISGTNLIATGTDGSAAVTCSPVADFCLLVSNHLCAGDSIQFTNCTYNADTLTYLWTFQGGTPSTSTAVNPFVRYNTPGVYDVTLQATSSTGTNTKTKIGAITVHGSAVFTPNYLDSFEVASTFPGDGYLINEDNGNTWERVTNAGYLSASSIKMNNYSGGHSGSVDEWVLSSITTLNFTTPQFSYRLAYARRDLTKTETLQIYVSTNCGKTWTLRKTLSGAALATTAQTTSSFIPTSASQWRLETVNILAYANKANLRIKFVFTSAADQNLYIDDINLTATPMGIDELAIAALNFDVYPNPASDNYHISFEMPQSDHAEIRITDLTGREIKTVVNSKLNAGDHEYTLDAREFSKGIYLVSLKTGNLSTIKKLIIN